MALTIFLLLTHWDLVAFQNTDTTSNSCTSVSNPLEVKNEETEEASIDEEIQKIQNSYENIVDIKGNFIQKSYIKDLRQRDIYKGQFYIKMPLKVKWLYKGKVAQEVFIDDNEILIYQKKEKQAFRGKFDRDTYGQSPISLLNGFGKIQEEFLVSRKNKNLLLKPKKPFGGILTVEIEPSKSKFPIGSFIITDIHSNRTEIILQDIELNTGLKDTFFKPSLPADIKIHEYNPGN
ncbi:MAG: outer membrane lipoprotein carrier protein LolA [Nitrospirae bacterium]|nr:outer membrane lipoprotein carrier protein LolA [Nitrospirota bacterium]